MPNAVVMTRYGPPEVLKWAGVPLPEPGQGQIRIKVKTAGISPTDLALRAGYLKDAIPLPPGAVLGFEAADTVDAAGPGVTGTATGDPVTALLLGLGGYAQYAVASIWAGKPESVSWADAAALPSSARRPSLRSPSSPTTAPAFAARPTNLRSPAMSRCCATSGPASGARRPTASSSDSSAR